jgi:hypothetical protein
MLYSKERSLGKSASRTLLKVKPFYFKLKVVIDAYA